MGVGAVQSTVNKLAEHSLSGSELRFWREFNKFTRSALGRPYIEGKLYEEIKRGILEFLGSPCGNWFDAGCGNLPVTRWIMEKANGEVSVWAGDIDISGAVEELPKLKYGSRVTILQVDLRERWPFEDNFFDGIVANHVFTFLARFPQRTDGKEPVVAALQEAYRVLKPGGVLICTVPRPEASIVNGLPSALKYLVNPVRWCKYGGSLFVTVIKTAKYIREIENKTKSGIYSALTREDCELILRSVGFSDLAWRLVFARQSWLTRAVKPIF